MIIREAKKLRYEDSAQAYYEVEAGDANATVKIKEGQFNFEWHRRKSNEKGWDRGW